MGTESPRYVCKLISEGLKLPVMFLDLEGRIAFEWSPLAEVNPLWPSKEAVISRLRLNLGAYDIPVIQSTDFWEVFLLIHSRSGTLVVGPVLESDISGDTVEGLMNDHKLLYKYLPSLVRYYQTVPVINRAQFMYIGLMIHQMLYQQELDLSDIGQVKHGDVRDRVDMAISGEHQRDYAHRVSYRHDIHTFRFIKAGDKDGLLRHLTEFPAYPEVWFGTLATKSHLRHRKNLAICDAALATRSAVEGGVIPGSAYSIRDLYIQTIEVSTSGEEITNLVQGLFKQLTDLVQESHQNRYSRPVHRARTYVYENIYNDFSVAEVAKYCQLHPAYLSRLFKKEVGVSLGEYVQQEKIEQAKRLLSLFNSSVSDTCGLLHYYDQSYFTKVFRRYTGLTPRQFQKSSAYLYHDKIIP